MAPLQSRPLGSEPMRRSISSSPGNSAVRPGDPRISALRARETDERTTRERGEGGGGLRGQTSIAGTGNRHLPMTTPVTGEPRFQRSAASRQPELGAWSFALCLERGNQIRGSSAPKSGGPRGGVPPPPPSTRCQSRPRPSGTSRASLPETSTWEGDWEHPVASGAPNPRQEGFKPPSSSEDGNPYPEGSVSTGASEAERSPPVNVWGIPGGTRPGLQGVLCYAGAPSPTHYIHGTRTLQRPSLRIARDAAGQPHPTHYPRQPPGPDARAQGPHSEILGGAGITMPDTSTIPLDLCAVDQTGYGLTTEDAGTEERRRQGMPIPP
ncbi:unnamed protein product [Bemisia tabaci]|uniref:Uncharacterized protein n=1 Tax=Bemisia tabaci TaxID=7038 RepID=A0A9P0ANF1_BEMTA|nr:unnamed protein product [Bemisia tabaci]